jgi:phage tail tape-measure protein
MIESTLTAIWSEKYGGAMDKLSGTWAGMVSNLKDQWARFANNTMNAGLFDWMKTRLGGLLTELDRMAANGELQAWAERTGKALVTFAENAWALGKAIVDTTAKIAAFVGGWTNLGILIVAVKFIPLAIAVGKLGAALFTATSAVLMMATGTATLGAALKTIGMLLLGNPIGIALTALTVAGVMLWKNWDGVKAGLVAIWENIRDAGIAAFDALKSAIGGVIDWLAEKTAWIFANVDKVKSAASSIGDGVGNVWSRARSAVGLGGDSAPPSAPMRVQTAPVSAGRGGSTYTDQSQFNAPITIQGASDPQATARAVREELDRRDRERAAARRGTMIDALGY